MAIIESRRMKLVRNSVRRTLCSLAEVACRCVCARQAFQGRRSTWQGSKVRRVERLEHFRKDAQEFANDMGIHRIDFCSCILCPGSLPFFMATSCSHPLPSTNFTCHTCCALIPLRSTLQMFSLGHGGLEPRVLQPFIQDPARNVAGYPKSRNDLHRRQRTSQANAVEESNVDLPVMCHCFLHAAERQGIRHASVKAGGCKSLAEYWSGAQGIRATETSLNTSAAATSTWKRA